jgi:Concanavalin A-like lectin/glucanases superfamily
MMAIEEGLAGCWPLQGDCRDHSGNGHHGTSRGAAAPAGVFEGGDCGIEIPYSPTLDLGKGDFTLSAWICTEPGVEYVIGDLLTQYDATQRRGFTLGITSSAGGYNSQGSDRHVQFGIDDGRTSDWEECGRPCATSNYVSNSLTVFDGSLYAATTDAATEKDWCHVYRYAGGQDWEDCGRVGDLRTRGVGPMLVHDGALFAATWSYDWTRVHAEPLDFCRVYRYQGGRSWEDWGQPGQCLRLFSMASFRGALYVVGDDNRCYVRAPGETAWQVCGEFEHLAHPLAVHAGRLHAGVFNAAVLAYDGRRWSSLGNPLGSVECCNQIHALAVYRGRLHATTWPEGHVAAYDPARGWVDCGRLGDSMEMNALVVYNGKLYAGAIPRAEVYRYEGGQEWTLMKRFFSPEGWDPIPVAHAPSPEARRRVAEWTRVTSLTVHDGRLFAGIGSCTSAFRDAPCDVRGKVFAMRAGQCASYDRDLGAGWKHLVAMRSGGRLELWVDGARAAVSPAWDEPACDLSNGMPLKIGAGEIDGFSGGIRDVRVYRRALSDREIAALSDRRPT